MDANLKLDDATFKAVEDLVEAGGFATGEDVVREGVRLVREREARRARLEAFVQPAIEAIGRGEGIPAAEAFSQLRARYEGDASEHLR